MSWGGKDWTTSNLGLQFQAIFQKNAWTLEGEKGEPNKSYGGRGRSFGVEEIAAKKDEIEKTPEEARDQNLSSGWEGAV